MSLDAQTSVLIAVLSSAIVICATLIVSTFIIDYKQDGDFSEQD